MKKNLFLFNAAFFIMFLSNPVHASDFKFWYGLTGSGADAVQSLCAAFNAEQARDRVFCASQGNYETVMQMTVAAYRVGNQPAIAQILDIGTLDMLLSDAIYPLHDLMRDAGYDEGAGGLLAAAAAPYVAKDGRLAALPFPATTLVLYTNQDKLAAAGAPADLETVEAFEEALRRLSAHGEKCPFVSDLHPWRLLDQFSAIEGLPVATRSNGHEGLDARYQLDSPVLRRELDDYKRWHDAGWLRLPSETHAGDLTNAFASGECALTMDSSGAYGNIRAAAGGFNIAIRYLPIYDGSERHGSATGGAALWIMKGFSAATYAGVAAFMRFLERPENQLFLTERMGALPITAKALAWAKYKGVLAQPAFGGVELAISSMSYPAAQGAASIRLGFYAQFRDIWRENLTQALVGQKTISMALDDTAERGDRLLTRFARTFDGASAP